VERRQGAPRKETEEKGRMGKKKRGERRLEQQQASKSSTAVTDGDAIYVSRRLLTGICRDSSEKRREEKRRRTKNPFFFREISISCG
jgi:hypothetical protein